MEDAGDPIFRKKNAQPPHTHKMLRYAHMNNTSERNAPEMLTKLMHMQFEFHWFTIHRRIRNTATAHM